MVGETISRAILKQLLRRRDFGFMRMTSTWTAELVVKSPFKEVVIPGLTVPEYIWQNLDRWAEKTAVVCGISGRGYTYVQVWRHSRALAARLRRVFRVQDGDVICVVLPNAPEYPLVVLGALQAGAATTTVNPAYTAHEISRQLLLAKPKLIVTSPEFIHVIKEALIQIKRHIPIICNTNAGQPTPPGTISLQELYQGDVDTSILKEVRSRAEDVCFLPYSSGTTGLPKGVEITNRNIVANLCQQNEERIRHYNETTKFYQDIALTVLPLFHIYGLSTLMLHKLSVGAKLVTVPKFQANTFLKVLEDHKISLFYGAPLLVNFLATHPEVKPEHLAHVNVFMSASAPLPLADIHKLFTKAQRDFDFLQGYGMTETSPRATLMTRHSKEYGSVGYAIPNTKLKIVNDELKSLGPGQVGEILIRGPQVMKGYKDNPEATKKAFTADGWFRSGDLASINEGGAVVIVDRLKDLIKVKGFQVPPAELEGVIKEHTKVSDAGVIGIADERYGEVPKAFVVVKEGEKVNRKEIMDFVAKRVAKYKRLHDVVFLNALPKNSTGKLLRRVLKSDFS